VRTLWKVEWEDAARRELRRMGHSEQQRGIRYLRERIATAEDPRRFGKALTANKTGLWRYRVGDHRIVCRIEDDRFIVLVLAVGHRKEIYD
jgi:mRNA interferase RelE/StbE